MKFNSKNNTGAVMAEIALTMPIFVMILFSIFEISRTLYIQNMLAIGAQKVAEAIAINAKRGSTFDMTGWGSYASTVKFPGAILDSSQFSFNVTDALNNSTVSGTSADGTASTKVVVTVVFPPVGSPGLKIPLFDPGNLIGCPIFGASGLNLSSSATVIIERSNKPILGS